MTAEFEGSSERCYTYRYKYCEILYLLQYYMLVYAVMVSYPASMTNQVGGAAPNQFWMITQW